MTIQEFTILSIEDNEPDFMLLKSALQTIPNLSLNIININNGKKALDFLFKKEEYKTAKTPDIVILDINLPLISGMEILKKIKQDDNYKVIPVIMFSTSALPQDIEESYKEYANSYITKSFDIHELFEKIAKMGEYWLKISEIPDNNNICLIENKWEIE